MSDVKVIPISKEYRDNYDSIFQYELKKRFAGRKVNIPSADSDLMYQNDATQDTWERPNSGRSYVSRDNLIKTPASGAKNGGEVEGENPSPGT